MKSSANEFLFWAALLPNQFFMTFPPLCLRVHWRESSCKTQDWFHGAKESEGGNMSHIYVILVTSTIRHTGSLCSYCLLSADEYVLSELGELSKICLWSPLEDLVPSQSLCCLLIFFPVSELFTLNILELCLPSALVQQRTQGLFINHELYFLSLTLYCKYALCDW